MLNWYVFVPRHATKTTVEQVSVHRIRRLFVQQLCNTFAQIFMDENICGWLLESQKPQKFSPELFRVHMLPFEGLSGSICTRHSELFCNSQKLLLLDFEQQLNNSRNLITLTSFAWTRHQSLCTVQCRKCFPTKWVYPSVCLQPQRSHCELPGVGSKGHVLAHSEGMYCF